MSPRSVRLGLAGAVLIAGAGVAHALDFEGTRDSVAIFSPYVAPDPTTGAYHIPVVAWIYEKENDRSRRAFLRKLELGLGVADGSEEQRIFRQRMGALLADNERGERLEVAIGAESFAVGISDKRGYVERTLTLSAAKLAGSLRTEGGRTVLPMTYRTRSTAGEAVAVVIPPDGLSVISDVDDTVKVTEVLDRGATFRNTFTREFRAVPGMAALYQGWQKRGAAFHYVSASPWQLAQFLEPFLQNSGFPAGTFHLRPLRPRSPESLKSFLTEGAADKRKRIEDLLQLFPRRRFILVGDSGERDPEIYGELARRHAGRIEHVYIRKVVGAVNTPLRFGQAFADLAATTWTVFEDPTVLRIPEQPVVPVRTP